MKRQASITLFAALAVLASSCNEKISPTLQNASSSTTIPGSGGPTTTTAEHYFRVVDKSPVLLNYKLHKTGTGNGLSKCEIKDTSALSSEKFTTNAALFNGYCSDGITTNETSCIAGGGTWSSYDITCFMEAEELGFLFNGFDWQIEASPNACEYVGYAPFSFYDKPAGSSGSSYMTVKCDPGVTSAAATASNPYGLDCNEWIDTSSPTATKGMIASEDELCQFNYSQDKCDIGEIDITERYIPTETTGTPPVTVIMPPITNFRRKFCGGTIANCAKGPMKDISGYIQGASYFTEITNTTHDTAFEKMITNPSPKSKGFNSNKYYVNYRRNLANPTIDFGSSFETLAPGTINSPASVSYKNAFSGVKDFDPRLIELYSKNSMMDYNLLNGTNNPIVLPSMQDNATYMNLYSWTARPFIAEPFMAYDEIYAPNPFYTVTCLDSAFDIKARIRIVIREWDRTLPTQTNSGQWELLSDLVSGSNGRQDIPWIWEITNQNPAFNRYNDLSDWDDRIPMDRLTDSSTSTQTYNPAETKWYPTPAPGTNPYNNSQGNPNYTGGFFNPSYFTNGSY